MDVVEYFESRPHKAVTVPVERGREIKDWREVKMPKSARIQRRQSARLKEEEKEKKRKAKGRERGDEFDLCPRAEADRCC